MGEIRSKRTVYAETARAPQNLLFHALHSFSNTRLRHTIRDIADNAAITSNPGTSFPAPCAGVVTGGVVGDTVDVCLSQRTRNALKRVDSTWIYLYI